MTKQQRTNRIDENEPEEVEIVPWSFQREILEADDPYIVSPAGTGTGKTIAIGYKLAQWIARWPDKDYLVISPSYPLFESAMFKRLGPIEFICETLRLGTFRGGTSPQIKLHTGGRILFRFGTAPRSFHSIHAKGVIVDEAGFLDDEAGKVALTRGRQERGRYYIEGYPHAAEGWYRDLVESGLNGDPRVRVIKVKTEESPYYDKEELADARKRLSAWEYAQMYEGDFTRAVGAIYEPLVTAPLPDEVRARLELYAGWDYGLNTAAVMLGWDGDRCWLLGFYKDYNKTNDVHAKAAKIMGFDQVFRAWGDPSGTQSWPDYRQWGFHIEDAKGGAGSVLAGIKKIQTLQNTIAPDGLPLLVAAENAQGLGVFRQEIDSYRYHTDMDGKPILDKHGRPVPVKENDHLMDAMRYGITMSRPFGIDPEAKIRTRKSVWARGRRE